MKAKRNCPFTKQDHIDNVTARLLELSRPGLSRPLTEKEFVDILNIAYELGWDSCTWGVRKALKKK